MDYIIYIIIFSVIISIIVGVYFYIKSKNAQSSSPASTATPILTPAAAPSYATLQASYPISSYISSSTGSVSIPSNFFPINQPIKNLSNTSYAINVDGFDKKPLYPLDLWLYQPGYTNIEWTYTNGTLVNTNSGLCLDIQNGDNTPGTYVGQNVCDSSNSQRWIYNLDNTLTSSQAPGSCLDISSIVENGAPLVINTCNGTKTQKWTL